MAENRTAETDVMCAGLDVGPNTDGEPCDWCRSCGRPSAEHPTGIAFDGRGGLYLPPEYAYIGVAMDRRDAADEMQRAFDGARAARATTTEETP